MKNREVELTPCEFLDKDIDTRLFSWTGICTDFHHFRIDRADRNQPVAKVLGNSCRAIFRWEISLAAVVLDFSIEGRFQSLARCAFAWFKKLGRGNFPPPMLNRWKW